MDGRISERELRTGEPGMGEVATGKRVGGGEVAIGDAGQSRCTRRGGLLACEGEGGGRGGGERCAENVPGVIKVSVCPCVNWNSQIVRTSDPGGLSSR